MKPKRWRSDEAILVFAGVAGLGLSVIYACKPDAGSPDPDPADDDFASDAGERRDAAAGTDNASQCSSDPSTADNTAAVVSAVDTLLAALTDEQRTAIRYDKTLANAVQWSNFPAGVVKRNGVKLGDMSDDAKAAAEALAEVAAGPTGATLLREIRAGDEAFASMSQDSSLFGDGNYYYSIHGDASTTSPWMLQIAGHHVAYNITYGGKCTAATPLFDGVQPSTWTDSHGQAQGPLEAQRSAFSQLLSSVSSHADAKLSGTFSDMINGPSSLMGMSGGGGNDAKFPAQLSYPTGTSGRGVSVGSLDDEQKALVKTTMEAWVKNVAEPVSSALLAVYESDDALAHTYVAYSGATDLSTTASYARIDGPRIWIEFTVQEGTDKSPQGHYHTIWRDKVADYGADYL